MEQIKTKLGNGNFKRKFANLVRKYVRVLFAANLETISSLLSVAKQWAFSIAGDGSLCHGISFFDVRVRLMVDGVLRDIQIVIVPSFDVLTAVSIVHLICVILDAIAPTWSQMLLSARTDGENTMTGHLGGAATLLEREAENEVLRIWFPSHHVDLVIKDATKDADGVEC